MNKTEMLQDIRKLNVVERLSIITYIWDEIKESKDLYSVSDEEKRLLVNRLANYRANPDSATDWSNLKQEIYKKYDKQG